MKLPITDQFLWDLYSAFEKTAGVRDFVFAPRYKRLEIFLGLENPVFRKYKNEMGARKFSKLIYYLKVNNYIAVEALKGKEGLLLSKKGISKALEASFSIQGKKKRADGKWIMLTFDIPQKHRKARILLRGIIRNLGYNMFQQSIWVCPYDVSGETEKLLQMHNLEKYVKIFLIEKL